MPIRCVAPATPTKISPKAKPVRFWQNVARPTRARNITYWITLIERLSGAPLRRTGDAITKRAPLPAGAAGRAPSRRSRSEEHTSELQSQSNLVCRLLLEKKKKKQDN